MNTVVLIGLLAIQLLLDIVSFLLIARLLTALFAKDEYNPFVEFIYKWTNWVNTLKKIIPSYKKFEFATLFAIIVLEFFKIALVFLLNLKRISLSFGILIWVLASVINLFFSFLFYALLLRALLYWMQVNKDNAFYDLLFMITEPLLKPFRKFIPTIKYVDILAILMALILKVIAIVVFVPLIRWAEVSTILSTPLPFYLIYR